MDPFVDDGHEDNAESSLFHDDMDTGDGASPRMDTAKGGHDKKAVLWHVDSLKLKSASGEHSSLIADVRFSPSMPCLATSSFDKTVRVWDVDSPEYSLRTFTGHSSSVMSVDFHPIKEDLLCSCDVYYINNPKLKVKIVDGTSLAAAVVVNNIPKNTTNVLLVGHFSKVASLLSVVLCQNGIKVNVARRDAYEFLKLNMPKELVENLKFSKNYSSQVWLVGDGVTDDEQKKAAKGVHFIPFSQFPPKIVRKDCFYHSTPALTTPKD